MESFFGIGGPELLLILVLATIVLGPLRMVRAARQLGILLRDLRNYYQQLSSGLSEELAALDDLGKLDLNLNNIATPPAEQTGTIAPSQEATAPAEPSQSSAPRQESNAPLSLAESHTVQASESANDTPGSNTDPQP